VIQYSTAVAIESRSRGILDRPVKPGDDGGRYGDGGGSSLRISVHGNISAHCDHHPA
jgi:hypothetical protein